MKFETLPSIDYWVREHKKVCGNYKTHGEQFRYIFCPSGIVEGQKVICLECGKEFTDFAD